MNVQTAIGLFGTVVGILGGLYGLHRNRKTDDAAAGRQDGVVLTELGYIKGCVEDIKTELREQRKINTEVYTRLTAAEQSVKQAHRRIDAIGKH